MTTFIFNCASVIKKNKNINLELQKNESGIIENRNKEIYNQIEKF